MWFHRQLNLLRAVLTAHLKKDGKWKRFQIANFREHRTAYFNKRDKINDRTCNVTLQKYCPHTGVLGGIKQQQTNLIGWLVKVQRRLKERDLKSTELWALLVIVYLQHCSSKITTCFCLLPITVMLWRRETLVWTLLTAYNSFMFCRWSLCLHGSYWS